MINIRLLKENLNCFLLEDIEAVKNYYKNDKIFYDKISLNNDALLKRLCEMDPTSDYDKNISGKYIKWLLVLLKRNDAEFMKIINMADKEDDYKVKEFLESFNSDKIRKQLDKKDINQYKNYKEFREVMQKFKFEDSDISASSQYENIKDDIKKGNIELFYNGSNWLIVIPKNKQAGCDYGHDTSWCTANPERNAWDTYKHGNLYIFLDKKHNLKPTYQFHFEKNMFMDVYDKKINMIEFFDENIDVFDKFFPDVKGKLSKKEKLEANESKFLPTKYRELYKEYYSTNFIEFLKSLINASSRRAVEDLFKNSPSVIENIDVDGIYVDYIDIKQTDDVLNNLEISEYSVNYLSSHVSISDIKDMDEERKYMYNYVNEKNNKRFQEIITKYGLWSSYNFGEEGEFIEFMELIGANDVVDEMDSELYGAYDMALDRELNTLRKSYPIEFTGNSIEVYYTDALDYIISHNATNVRNFMEFFELIGKTEGFLSEDFIYEIGPSQEDLARFNIIFDEFLDTLENPDDAENENLIKLSKYGKLIKELGFEDNVIENKDIRIRINSYDIEADEVNITYHTMQTNRLETGNIKLVNLVKYVKNHDFFD